MLKANKIAGVIFPESVIRMGNKETESRNRQRSKDASETQRTVMSRASEKEKEYEFVLMPDGSWQARLKGGSDTESIYTPLHHL